MGKRQWTTITFVKCTIPQFHKRTHTHSDDFLDLFPQQAGGWRKRQKEPAWKTRNVGWCSAQSASADVHWDTAAKASKSTLGCYGNISIFVASPMHRTSSCLSLPDRVDRVAVSAPDSTREQWRGDKSLRSLPAHRSTATLTVLLLGSVLLP